MLGIFYLNPVLLFQTVPFLVVLLIYPVLFFSLFLHMDRFPSAGGFGFCLWHFLGQRLEVQLVSCGGSAYMPADFLTTSEGNPSGWMWLEGRTAISHAFIQAELMNSIKQALSLAFCTWKAACEFWDVYFVWEADLHGAAGAAVLPPAGEPPAGAPASGRGLRSRYIISP